MADKADYNTEEIQKDRLATGRVSTFRDGDVSVKIGRLNLEPVKHNSQLVSADISQQE